MQVPLDQSGISGLCVVDYREFSPRGKVLLRLFLQILVGPLMAVMYYCWSCKTAVPPKLRPGSPQDEDCSRNVPLLPAQDLEEDSGSPRQDHLPDCPGRRTDEHSGGESSDPLSVRVVSGPGDGGSTSPRPSGSAHPVAALGPRTDGWLLAATPPPCPGCRHHSAALLPLGARKWAAAVNFFLTAYAVLLVSLLRVVTCVGVPGTQSSKRFVLIQGDVQCLVGVWGQVIFAVLGVVVGPLLVWAAAAWSRAGSMTGDSDGTRNRRLGLRNALTACYKEDKYECGVGWRAAGCSAVVF